MVISHARPLLSDRSVAELRARGIAVDIVSGKDLSEHQEGDNYCNLFGTLYMCQYDAMN